MHKGHLDVTARAWIAATKRTFAAVRSAPPASPEAVQRAERGLGLALPEHLRDLYAVSDGLTGEYGAGLVWPVDRLLEENQAYRSNPEFAELYMPFDPLLFFADAGNGDLFGFTVLAGSVRRPDVFSWDHETDSRTWAAPDLRLYVEWWLSGRLEV